MTRQRIDVPQAERAAVRRPLSMKLVTNAGAILLLLAIGVAALTFTQVQSATSRELEQQGTAIAATLNFAFEGLLDRDALTELQRVATNSATVGAVKKVLIVDLDQQTLASSDRRDLGRRIDFPQLEEFRQRGRWESLVDASDDDTLVIVQPLHSGKFGGSSQLGVAGAIRIEIDRTAGRAAAYAAALRLLGVSVGSYVVLSAILGLVIRRLVVRPLHHLADTALRFRGGDRSVRSALQSRDELGLVSTAFDEMADEIQASIGKLEEEIAGRTEALSRLTSALEELKSSSDARLKLAETIRVLSTPVLRVYREIIVMPLIGDIDTERAQQIQASLLAGIEKHSARNVIVDLTGVPVVDTQVADWLLRAKRAAELLGAKVIFVGISSRVAQSMVHLDVTFSSMATHGDLQSGLLHALRSQGVHLHNRGRSSS